jgi:alginate O-acetyltransferase complex protein AlgI
VLFNSYEFLFLYLPVVTAVFFLIARNSHRLAALWLVAASLFFYGWWNPAYVSLLMASIMFNFGMGHAISRARTAQGVSWQTKLLFWLAIAINLALLGYYKYFNFFVTVTNDLAGTHPVLTEIILPLGISFFTFTQIAFLADVYRGIAREYNFIHYVLFVTYFPHLIAGPVLHHKQMMPQFALAETYRLTPENLNIGLTIFAIGLFKKVMLADQFALYANPVFDAVSQGGEPKLIEAWTGSLAYTFQLYFDFSGYTDMAIGLSRLFNVRLPINFNSPYKAGNIIEFWRRWHMTLSAFLREYLYIPLGGNRHGPVRRYANLLITMLLGGFWHGANWTFLVWGGLHGIYLVINHAWIALRQRLNIPALPYGRPFAVVITFAVVVIAWIPFRADNLSSACRMFLGLIGANGVSMPVSLAAFMSPLTWFEVSSNGAYPLTGLSIAETALWLVTGLIIVWCLPNAVQFVTGAGTDFDGKRCPSQWQCWRPSARIAMITGVSLAVSCLGISRASQFIYFQF